MKINNILVILFITILSLVNPYLTLLMAVLVIGHFIITGRTYEKQITNTLRQRQQLMQIKSLTNEAYKEVRYCKQKLNNNNKKEP